MSCETGTLCQAVPQPSLKPGPVTRRRLWGVCKLTSFSACPDAAAGARPGTRPGTHWARSVCTRICECAAWNMCFLTGSTTHTTCKNPSACWWERELAQPPWKTIWLWLPKLHRLLSRDPAVPSPEVHPTEGHLRVHRTACARTLWGAQPAGASNQKRPDT